MLNALYRGWSALVFLMVILQVGFAGYGAFYAADKTDNGATVNSDTFDHGFVLHVFFGYMVVLAGLIFLLIGVAAGVGKWRLGRHGLLFLLLVLQVILAIASYSTPVIGFLHPVNALLIFTLAGWIAWGEWKTSRGVAQPVAPA